MFMFRRLLVPLDGSETAENALPYAEEIAAKFGAEIILVSVSDSPNADMRHLYRPYLERIAGQVGLRLKDWADSKEATVVVKALKGKPADEILRCADENGVSLITMASRGASGGKWLLGNVAWKVLQAADRPVLLIRSPASNVAIEQKRLVRKILVPLDGSDVGGVVIPHVETLAQLLDAEVILFHVLETPAVGVLVPGVEIAYRTSTIEAEKSSHLKYLDDVEKALKEKGLSTSIVVNIGFAADEIVKYAESNAVDLIAMSTHGRSGIGRWVFGSVTHKILHTGSRPVLTARAKKQQ
jgi:nucleotide-binding universal stress UspA family protein